MFVNVVHNQHTIQHTLKYSRIFFSHKSTHDLQLIMKIPEAKLQASIACAYCV